MWTNFPDRGAKMNDFRHAPEPAPSLFGGLSLPALSARRTPKRPDPHRID